ncbi:MAG: hypothetical protein IPM66_21335 [Acidobacteriota bacterium]|nr:MAG: hypothetical protein IPM66_21335 [Acidobacteriota bacterium]
MQRFTCLSIILLCALLQQQPPSAQALRVQEPSTPVALKTSGRSLTARQFVSLTEKLSEPGGYFDTDNLISNETSYLHVLGKLRRMNVNGGAYIGVGPDQNFSYMAQIRPEIAFMIDIRRDNLLQHLVFKSLFALSRNRLEYLCLLIGRAAPADSGAWDKRDIAEIVAYLDRTPPGKDLLEATLKRVESEISGLGFELKTQDKATIRHILAEFHAAGLDLKFTSRNRSPRYYYPNYRELLLEKDLTGRQGNYLAREEDFRFLKSLQERNLVIPVIGNLAGESALRNIAKYLREEGRAVSAFYTSNVEFYLMRGDDFNRFAENVSALPRAENSVIIRSYFNGTWGYPHPQSVSGYYSTQLMQTIESFSSEYAKGGYQSYLDVIGKHMLDLR